jgi:putative ABC transport system permease protein
MIHAALRDLVWRRRRYLISVVGCGLVFGMSLLMSGLSNSFGVELDRTIAHLHARGFVVRDGVSGPFTGTKPFPQSEVAPGAVPLAYLVQSATAPGRAQPVTVAVFGLPPGSPAAPPVSSGRAARGPGEVVVDDRSDFRTGDRIVVGGAPFRVVGRVDGLSINGGVPGVVVDLAEVQRQLLSGAPLVTSSVVVDRAVTPAAGYHVVGATAAREDALRVLASAKDSISFVTGLLWAVAALIIGSVVFLSAIERTRDFAVFKAIGTSTPSMGIGLALQAVLLALAAAVVGLLVGLLLGPFFPLPVAISTAALVLLPVVALAVGVVASAFGLRKAVSVEPALAFGS